MTTHTKIELLCVLEHDNLELSFDHPRVEFKRQWRMKVFDSETVSIAVEDVKYGDVLLPVTVQSSLDGREYIRWERSDGRVQSRPIAPFTEMTIEVSVATGANRSKKSSTVIILEGGRPDVDDD